MISSIIFARDTPAGTIYARVARGELLRLGTGVYTTEISQSPEEIARAHVFEIAGRLMPDAVITDRSAPTGNIADGVLYLARPSRARELLLPGVTVRARPGAGPLEGDIPYPGGLHLASRQRALAENSVPPRVSKLGDRRTLNDTELADWVDLLCHKDGPEQLMQWRAEAERLAEELGVNPRHLVRLQSAVGIALGTKPANAKTSSVLASRRAGLPVDQARVALFKTLIEELRASAPQSRPEIAIPGQPGPREFLPFFEAYFSNFIEGTEFEVDEAKAIVFDGVIPENRPADAHDIAGTYRLVNSVDDMRRTGETAADFVDLVCSRNAAIMEGRPGNRPGQFKTFANRAGATHFVDPELVEGTLRAGFDLRGELDTAWERAVFLAFVVAEVHPFDDGNGRTARVVMSSELTAGGEDRIIVPTVFRQDYLDGLRLLSRRQNPTVFIKAMRYAHDFTASVDYSTFEGARDQLEQAHAFNEPESSERLLILGRRPAWE